MDKEEFEKCRNDVVYFVEKYMGFELTPTQKVILKAHQKGQRTYFRGMRHGKRVVYEAMKKFDEIFK